MRIILTVPIECSLDSFDEQAVREYAKENNCSLETAVGELWDRGQITLDSCDLGEIYSWNYEKIEVKES